MLEQIPFLNALRGKMQWLGARQRVLSDNVANAQTPRYKAKELEPFQFSTLVGRANRTDPSELRQTQRGHLTIRDRGLPGVKVMEDEQFWESLPNGNNVVLEEQMMKVAQNQMEFDTAVSLYKKSMAMVRRAVSNSQ